MATLSTDDNFPYSQRQLWFAKYIAAGATAAEAARLAGYSPNRAKQTGWDLLRNARM